MVMRTMADDVEAGKIGGVLVVGTPARGAHTRFDRYCFADTSTNELYELIGKAEHMKQYIISQISGPSIEHTGTQMPISPSPSEVQ